MSQRTHDIVSLSARPWTMAGYVGDEWHYRNAFVSQEPPSTSHAASVPGSVHWDLLQADQIVDPYRHRQSLACEWVAQRQWVYSTTFEIAEDWSFRRVALLFEGTDYLADVFVDGRHLGATTSLFAPSRFELVAEPGSHQLSVALHEAPAEQAQIGHTSRVRSRKPRMGYGWDFAPRLIHLGLWDEVKLVSTGAIGIANVWLRPQLHDDQRAALVDIEVAFDGPAPEDTSVRLEIELDGRAIAAVDSAVPAGADAVTRQVEIDEPALWWPNGMGPQHLYTCRVSAVVAGVVTDASSDQFGIRRLRMVSNLDGDDRRDDALPYTLEVNGQAVYLKGWNWVPVDAMYGRPDLSERYSDLVRLARDAHVNLLRVWGGGLIERREFYRLCDRHGLLVWQEFIQSSSGLDNDPPVDPTYLAELVAEAGAIVRSRRNHPSLAMWCGGNELATPDGPVTTDHPNIATLQAVVRELDPDRPFLPSSPSGPVFYLTEECATARPRDQHDVHGPWDYSGPNRSYAVYNSSTALLHSEFGVPGAAARTSLDRFVSRDAQWPPDAGNPHWVHHGSWWLQRDWIDQLFGPVDELEDYLQLSQWLQADLLGYAIDANRRRWPSCSGSLPWQLNEPWPNAVCTSAVDYYLRPKAAYWAVRQSYAPVSTSLRHDGLALGVQPATATVHVSADQQADGTVEVDLYALDGTQLGHEGYEFSGSGSRAIGAVTIDPRAHETGIVLVRLTLTTETDSVRRHYVFGGNDTASAPLQGLYRSPRADLHASWEGDRIVLRNDGPGVALFPAVDVDEETVQWQLSDNGPVLLPGETWDCRLTLQRRRQALGPHAPRRPGHPPAELDVAIRSWNCATRLTVPVRLT
jgi:beta-mannosidase